MNDSKKLTSSSETVQQVKATVHLWLGTKIVSRDELVTTLLSAVAALAPDLDAEIVSQIQFEIEKERIVVMDPGTVITAKNHVPWLSGRSDSIEWVRWNAYRNLLSSKKITPKVLDSMNSRNSLILDLAGDPLAEGKWSRRGLVIGDVQSGKTSNYLALFNKAADAGYKVFILLAGHTDNLRKQTQERVDEGFIGQDTRKWMNGTGLSFVPMNTKIGIGVYAQVKTNFHTTVINDFSAAAMSVGSEIDGATTPVIFVIKKNKKIMENLTTWLKNHAGQDGKISTPMMLLDDEADFASINTRPADESPTAINEAIRGLLGVFTKNTYIGYTATPFANVLIDDDQEEDLFPRNFIYSLESPSNYFGPMEMFETDENDQNSFIVPITDAEESIPFKHRSSHQFQGLPASLVDSIKIFFLANSIRDLRGQQKQPRSMLINVSRWVKVQNTLFAQVEEFVSTYRAVLGYSNADSNKEWDELERLYKLHFSKIPEKWDDVRKQLVKAIELVQVQVVNSKNKSAEWETIYQSENARVIAIGGDVLARGLTLEGLTTSYFYRRSLAYDTLMQMGRWFGYRDGYRDICRLWIDLEVAQWFRDIADALAELRQDLVEMAKRQLEPKDFGLSVKCHPGALLMVTSRNKSLSAVPEYRTVSTKNISKETSRLSSDPNHIANNWKSLESLISAMEAATSAKNRITSIQSRVWWKEIDQAHIADFLHNYVSDGLEPLFENNVLADFIRANVANHLKLWDVVLVSGSGPEIFESSLKVNSVQRSIMTKPDDKVLYVSGGNRRLGGPRDLSILVDSKVLESLEAEAAKSLSGKKLGTSDFRSHLTRPALIIYPITPATKANRGISSAKPLTKTTKHQSYVDYDPIPGQVPFVGFGLAFPSGSSETGSAADVKYLVNSVWQRLNSVVIDAVDDELEEGDFDE